MLTIDDFTEQNETSLIEKIKGLKNNYKKKVSVKKVKTVDFDKVPSEVLKHLLWRNKVLHDAN